MKFSILQENLKQGLAIVSHIAGKNVNLPILNHVLIEAKDNTISLITTDLEIGIINKMRGKVETEGSFAVEARTLYDFVSALPNDKISVDQSETAMQLSGDNFKTKINGQNSEEFPLIPSVERDSYFVAKTDEFRKALSQVIFATSNNENRVELSGLLLNIEGDKLVMAATDSFRLAEKAIDIKAVNAENRRIIVPSKTIQELIRIMSSFKEIAGVDSEGGEVKLFLSENQILFSIASTELVSRIIEGQYPDYKQIIPTQHKTRAVVNRSDFIRAIKASAVFSKTGINDINLDFPAGANKLVISSASGTSGENIFDVQCSVTGQDNGLVLNYRYLLDGLNNIETDNVILEAIDGNTPCVMHPEDKGQASYLYIVMPIKQ